MPAGQRTDPSDIEAAQRDPLSPVVRRPAVKPREINIAWASITEDDLAIGELVANRNDDSLVWRGDEANIYRFDYDAARVI